MSQATDAMAALARSAREATGAGLRRPGVVANAALAAVLLIPILFWSPSYWIGVLAAIVLPAVLYRYPATVVVFMAVVAEEVVSRPTVGAVTTLGGQAYFQGKVPLILIVTLSAAAIALARLRPWQWLPSIGRSTWVVAGIICALALVMLVDGFIDGQSLFSAINQNARPCVVCLAGLVIGVSIRFVPAEARATTCVAAVAIVGMAIAAGVSAALGWTADARVSSYYVYYDSALPALAMAVFLALIVLGSRYDWRTVLVTSACLVIVVVSFRRAVWLSAAVPLAAILLLIRYRLRSSRRLLLAAAGLAVFLVIVPGLASDVRARLVGAPAVHQTTTSASQAHTSATATPTAKPSRAASAPPPGASASPASTARSGSTTTTTGSKPKATPTNRRAEDNVDSPGADVASDSTEGHVGDLRIGLSIVRQHFWTGLGPRAPQPPGLAATKSQRVYVHDEWLLDWLRYGPLAALLVTAFVVALTLMAIRVLYRPDSALIERTVALFALITPGVLVLFPYVTTTTRWPLLLGIAAGVMGGRLGAVEGQAVGRHRRGEATDNQVDPGLPVEPRDAAEVSG